MAEAHSAVAFSFSVTPEGLDVKLNHEALKAVWRSGFRSAKKRVGRMQVNFTVYFTYKNVLVKKDTCMYSCHM